MSNWQNRLALSGSGLEGLGQSDVRGAVNAIAAFLAMQDIYKAAQSPQRDVAGVLAAAWWTHRIEANVATVTLGRSARQFLSSAGTEWVASGGGGYATLTQSGSRVQFENLCAAIGEDSPYAGSRGWDAAGMSFAVSNAGSDVEHFGYWLNIYKNNPLDDNKCGRVDGFRLTGWTFPSGMAVSLSYGPPAGTGDIDALLEVANSLGRKIDFTWNGSQLTGFNNALTAANARSVGLGASSHTDPNGKTTSFTFTAAQVASATQRPLPYGLLDKVFTADNAVQANLDYDYDGVNRAMSVKDADAIQLGGRNPYSFYIADGTRGERDDPLGASYSVVYDTFRHPARYIDELGRETDATSDGRGRVLSYTYPELDQEVLSYDERNNPLTLTRKAKPGSGLADIAVSESYTEGVTVAICATPATCNKPVTQTNALGAVTNIAWDATTGQLTQIKLPADNAGQRPQTDYAYTSFGTGFHLLTSKTEKIDAGDSLQTSFAWNASNDYVPQSTTVDSTLFGLNLTTTFAYDAQGDMTEVVDPRNIVVGDFTHDLDRRPVFTIQADPDGAAPHPRPAAKSIYDPEGRVVESDTGTTTSATGTDFATTLAVMDTYDPVGNKIEETTPTRATQFSYDGDDRLLCTAARMNPAVFGSLPADACTLGTTGSFGPDRIVKNIYDMGGQLRQEVRAFGVSGTQQTYATYKFSPNGKLIVVADADIGVPIGVSYADALNANASAWHQTNYAYDGFDRLLMTTFADGSTDQQSYYAAGALCSSNGQPCTRTNRSGQVFTLSYDGLDRLVTKVVPAGDSPVLGHTVLTAYDLRNAITGVTDTFSDSSQNIIANVYDIVGRLSTSTRTTPLLSSKTVSYQYDDASNRTRLTWPDGYYANYSYDALNNPTTVIDSDSTTLATYGYDDLARRTALNYNGTTGAAIAYAWSPESDLTTLTSDFVGSSNDVSFTNTSTPAHQWASATTSNSAYIYAPVGTTTTAYDPVNSLNQYQSIGGGFLTWDLNGNLSSSSNGNWTYLHDPENRMTRAGKQDRSFTETFAYDPLGRRTAKTANGVTTNFLHDGDNEIAEYDGSGTLTRRFVPGSAIDDYVAMITAAGVKTFVHTDKMGSVIAVSDTSGAIVEGPYTYDAYGNCFTSAGASCTAVGIPFRFAGQRFDAETNLYYYRARYYGPGIGRFYETDPAGYGPDLNPYTYGGNDPTDRIDPTGLEDVAQGVGNMAGTTCGRTGDQSCSGHYSRDGEGTWSKPSSGQIKPASGRNVQVAVEIGPEDDEPEGKEGKSDEDTMREGLQRDAAGRDPISPSGWLDREVIDNGIERDIAGYQVWGTAGRQLDDYIVNIGGLYATGSAQGLTSFYTSLVEEAEMSGATRLVIQGTGIINRGFTGPNAASIAARFGFTYERLDENAIRLTMPITPTLP